MIKYSRVLVIEYFIFVQMALIHTMAYQCQRARGGEGGKSSSTLLQGTLTDQPVGNEHVQGLCDGGFTRSDCVEERHCGLVLRGPGVILILAVGTAQANQQQSST